MRRASSSSLLANEPSSAAASASSMTAQASSTQLPDHTHACQRHDMTWEDLGRAGGRAGRSARWLWCQASCLLHICRSLRVLTRSGKHVDEGTSKGTFLSLSLSPSLSLSGQKGGRASQPLQVCSGSLCCMRLPLLEKEGFRGGRKGSDAAGTVRERSTISQKSSKGSRKGRGRRA